MQFSSCVKKSIGCFTLISLEFLPDGTTPIVSSKEVALRFQKKRKHILEEIRRIQSMVPKGFYEPNFRPIEESVLLPHSGGVRNDPARLIFIRSACFYCRSQVA